MCKRLRFLTLLAVLVLPTQAMSALASEAQEVIHAVDMPETQAAGTFFTGVVRQQRMFVPTDDAPYSVTLVTFEPGARTLWHTHPAGQRLVVLDGEGRTGTADGRVRVLKKGDVVWCPPRVKHWHGASPTSSMRHLALTGSDNGATVQWLDAVTEQEYAKKPQE